MPTHTAHCACGKVEIAFHSAPIATTSCACDDCQAAGAALEALPGAPAYRDPCGATPVALFARRAMQITRGAEHLTAHRKHPKSVTRRMVADCCQSFLYIDFDKGPFWVSAALARLDAPAPKPTWRIQTRFLPTPPPDDLKNHPKFPPSLFARIALGGLRSLLTRRPAP